MRVGLGLGLNKAQYIPRTKKNNAGNDILYEPKKNSLIESASMWIPDITDELFKYFLKNPDKMRELHPRKFEELIASIFKNQGLMLN